MELQALARAILPARAAGRRLVPLLCRSVRRLRAEWQLLSAAERGCRGKLGTSGAARLPVRLEGVALPDPCQEAARPGRQPRPHLRPHARPWTARRAGAVPASPGDAPRRRAARSTTSATATRLSMRGGVPSPELVRGRDLRP